MGIYLFSVINTPQKNNPNLIWHLPNYRENISNFLHGTYIYSKGSMSQRIEKLFQNPFGPIITDHYNSGSRLALINGMVL